MIDYTKLRQKLTPNPGGEDVLRIRVGVIGAVNADGTADLVLGGVTIPSVPRLDSAAVQVGAVVQVISQRGGLLILGQVAKDLTSAGLGLWARGQSFSPSAGVGISFTTVLTTASATFVRNRAYEIRTHGGAHSTAVNYVDVRAYRAGGAQIGEFYRYPLAAGSGIVFNVTGAGVYFTVSDAGNVTGAVDLRIASSSATTITHFASSFQERSVEVWDVGERSKFPDAPTW